MDGSLWFDTRILGYTGVMSFRTPREDSVLVATGVRNHLATALDGLDVLIDDDDGSLTLSERRAIKAGREAVLSAIRQLNDAPELTGLTDLDIRQPKPLSEIIP